MTCKGAEDRQGHRYDVAQGEGLAIKKCHHLRPDVLPPHGALQSPGITLEAERLCLQVVGRLDEQLDALSSLQNLRPDSRLSYSDTPHLTNGHSNSYAGLVATADRCDTVFEWPRHT